MFKNAIIGFVFINLFGVCLPVTAKEKSFTEFGSTVASTQTMVDLNTATVEQLMTLKGVGRKKALAIIDYRQLHSGFRHVEELDAIQGIGPKLIKQNLSRLTIYGYQTQTLSLPETKTTHRRRLHSCTK
jgi:competence protein ComEA helix-hairpin-helix repeat region